MTPEDLPPGWTPPRPHSLAASVGFGQRLIEEVQAERRRKDAAASLEIPLELADLWKSIHESQRELLISEFRQLSEQFPSASPANLALREFRVSADAQEAPDWRAESRDIRITSSEYTVTKAKAKQYLANQYSKDERVFCQACHRPSEFEVKGSPYFETVQFLKRRKVLLHQNFLALCPLCSAKYQYVREPDDPSLLEAFLQLEIQTDAPHIDLPVYLNQRLVSIRFTVTHAFDLKNALSVAGQER